jgi:hypothetical protein
MVYSTNYRILDLGTGMANMNIVAWVEDHVIGYFADRFHYPNTVFKWDTNVRKAFNFDSTAWAEIADQLNRKDWMIQIHVLLAQREMGSKNTIGDLTGLICDKYRAERTFAADASLLATGSAKTLKRPTKPRNQESKADRT